VGLDVEINGNNVTSVKSRRVGPDDMALQAHVP
ncbi:hypothetical protein CCACVL1_03705, partial [Corchorus capsularis]